jgi:DNA modification methylase
VITLLAGDCRETLRTLDAGSVQACITSPPYWGLRDYGTPPLVWGGDAEHAHEWGAQLVATKRPGTTADNYSSMKQRSNNGALVDFVQGSFCTCGAWLGSLGLEPTPDCGRPAVKLRAGLTQRERAYVVKRLRETGVLK